VTSSSTTVATRLQHSGAVQKCALTASISAGSSKTADVHRIAASLSLREQQFAIATLEFPVAPFELLPVNVAGLRVIYGAVQYFDGSETIQGNGCDRNSWRAGIPTSSPLV